MTCLSARHLALALKIAAVAVTAGLTAGAPAAASAPGALAPAMSAAGASARVDSAAGRPDGALTVSIPTVAVVRVTNGRMAKAWTNSGGPPAVTDQCTS